MDMFGIGAAADLAGGLLSVPFQIGGALLGAGEADKRRQQMESIANTPGVDFGGVTGDVLGTMEKYAPQAGQIVGGMAKDQASAQLGALNEFDPRFQERRTELDEYYGGLMRGEVPRDMQEQLQRSAAVQSLGGGFGGTGMHRNLMARDLGMTSLQLSQMGAQGMQGQQAFTGQLTPQAARIEQFTGPSISQALQTRSAERAGKIQNLLAAAGLPTGSETIAAGLGQAGANLAGVTSSAGGMMGSGMFGGGQQPVPQPVSRAAGAGSMAGMAVGGMGPMGMMPGMMQAMGY